MSENEQLATEQAAGKKGKGDGSGRARGPREETSLQSQALGQMQRARKALGSAEGGDAMDYHIRIATVLALLDLADAVRGSKSPS